MNKNIHMRIHNGENHLIARFVSNHFHGKTILSCILEHMSMNFGLYARNMANNLPKKKQKNFMRIGAKKRQFECYHCRFKSSGISYLKQHMKSKHTGQKSFQYDICEKKFVCKHKCNTHIWPHIALFSRISAPSAS